MSREGTATGGLLRDGAEIVERALAASRADGCVAIASESSEANLRWANNTLTTNGAVRDRSVTVIAIVGRSFGVKSASAVDAAGLTELVRAAEAAARESGPAEDAAELVTGGQAADFADPVPYTSTGVFAGLAADLGEAFATARAAKRTLYGFASHDLTTTWLGTSTGVRARHTEPTGTVEWTAKGAAAGESVWHGQTTRDFADVSVPDTVALLDRRLGWSGRRVELPAGRYETILPPTSVADLMIYAYWTASARDAAEGRTVFSRHGGAAGATRVGERLGAAGLTLYSDPYEPGLETTPFVAAAGSSSVSSVFDNGLPLTRTDWLADGTLAALATTRASAASTGLALHPYVGNLALDGGGSASIDEMVAATRGPALLLTCMWYIREVDAETLLVTGLTRDGVYLVEDGEVAGLVNNFRFNESPVDLLGRFTEVGASVPTYPREWGDYFTLTRMPPVRVPDFHLSSVSPAS